MCALVRPRHLRLISTQTIQLQLHARHLSKNMIHAGMAHMNAGGTARIISGWALVYVIC
jgi:hypothetical protein